MTLTENCDIYNFRVVALETLMGRHPRELISSSLDDSSNKNIMVKDLLDLRIRLPLITLALTCLRSKPKLRPSMQQVRTKLAYTMTLIENCDVSSFRVVALETLMGRHLRELISSSLDDSSNKSIMVKDLLDPHIRLPLSQKKLKL
ncbi:hypothetical protein HN873_061167 [Arachis hypogaea]